MHAAHSPLRTFLVRSLITVAVIAAILIEPAILLYSVYGRAIANEVAALCRDVKLPEISASAPR